MIVDIVLAALAGLAADSWILFLILVGVAAPFVRPRRPFASSLVRLALLLSGMSVLWALLGGRDGDGER